MSQSLLEIFRRSGDANLGQTLIRLAHLAEAAHAYQSVEEGDAIQFRRDQRRAQGSGPRPVVSPARTDAGEPQPGREDRPGALGTTRGAVRTEVGR